MIVSRWGNLKDVKITFVSDGIQGEKSVKDKFSKTVVGHVKTKSRIIFGLEINYKVKKQIIRTGNSRRMEIQILLNLVNHLIEFVFDLSI